MSWFLGTVALHELGLQGGGLVCQIQQPVFWRREIKNQADQPMASVTFQIIRSSPGAFGASTSNHGVEVKKCPTVANVVFSEVTIVRKVPPSFSRKAKASTEFSEVIINANGFLLNSKTPTSRKSYVFKWCPCLLLLIEETST